MRSHDFSPVALRFLILGMLALFMLLVPLLTGPERAGAAPAFALQAADGDGDGLSDADEAAQGTDPTDEDSDDDGVLDGGEINAGTDPLQADTDGDGFTDKAELDRQSDPLDAESVPGSGDTGVLTVTLMECPVDYQGKELWDECVTPLAGVEVVLGLNASEFGLQEVTDANGQVVFSGFGPGEYTLTQLGDGAIARSSIVCFGEPEVAGAPEPRQVSATPNADGSYGFLFEEVGNIACDWFLSPASSDAPADDDAPVTGLPSTGSGSAGQSDMTSRAMFAARMAGLMVLLGAGLHRYSRRLT